MDIRVIKYLIQTKDHPAIRVIADDGEQIEALIDTGAHMPVWTKGAKSLMEAYPSASLCKDTVFPLGGFGGSGKYNRAEIYEIGRFILKSDEPESETVLSFNRFMIACCEQPHISYKLILPATMLKHTDYHICNRSANPYFEIICDKTEFEIRSKFSAVDANVIEKIYSFVQE